MADYVIIPDTACDLRKDLRDRFGIPDYMRGIIYFPDGHSEHVDLDWGEHDPKTFYESMRDKTTLYKTASPKAGEIMQLFEKYLQQGKDIIAITLSSALSGTFQECELIKKELEQKYPERKIVIVDSLRYSTALSIFVVMAAQKQQEGATLEETVQYLEENKHKVHQIGPMDDLFFLVKTGRISNFKAFFGTLVGVNPMADFNRKGMAEVLCRFKGKKAAFDAVIEYMKATVINPQDQIMFVAHSNRLQQAEILAERIRKEFSPKEVIINDVGMACGATVGPGLCAAFYQGTEISENCEKEKEIMAEIALKFKNKGDK